MPSRVLPILGCAAHARPPVLSACRQRDTPQPRCRCQGTGLPTTRKRLSVFPSGSDEAALRLRAPQVGSPSLGSLWTSFAQGASPLSAPGCFPWGTAFTCDLFLVSLNSHTSSGGYGRVCMSSPVCCRILSLRAMSLEGGFRFTLFFGPRGGCRRMFGSRYAPGGISLSPRQR